MRKTIFYILILCLFPLISFAQSSDEWKEYSGKLILKPWTKSAQSYCAGGSDYYVMTGEGEEEWVLEFDKNIDLASVEKLKNRLIVIVAQEAEKTITASNPHEQRPVSMPITKGGTKNDDAFKCKVYKVKQIELAK